MTKTNLKRNWFWLTVLERIRCWWWRLVIAGFKRPKEKNPKLHFYVIKSVLSAVLLCDSLLIDIEALNSWRRYVLTNEFRIYACSVLFQISCQNDSSIARGPFTQCIEQSQTKLRAIVTELNKWRQLKYITKY